MRRSTLGLAGLLAAALSGCSDNPYDPNTPAIDPKAPRIHLTSPARGTFAGDVQMVTVTGTATDDGAVTSVTVNDVPATLASDGSFTVMVPVVPGTNLLHAVAKDAEGNAGKESRAVVAGPTQKIDLKVPNGITATLSAQTFTAISHGVTTFLKTGDLEALIAPHNPVIGVGGGPDCLYGQASITSITVGNANASLVPQTGGIHLEVMLDQLQIGMHLQYAAACVNGSRDITVGASHVSITGDLTVALNAGAFDVHLINQNVGITGLDLQLGGIPGAVVSLLHLDTALGPVLGWAAEKFVAPMVSKAFSGLLNNTKTVSVLGRMVDISVQPSQVTFSPQGGIVMLDTSLRAHGDIQSPGFVYVANTTPAMDLTHGFQLAVADDAANQLFGSLWAAKGLDQTLDLKTGTYGEVGKLYDSVELSAAVPPFVDASSPEALKLTIGDLMATFRNGEVAVTQIAINAEVDLKVTSDANGSRLDVGQPTVYVDILDEGVTGANQLSTAQFETIASFALSRIIAVGSGSVGAIPLPSVAGISVSNLGIAEQTGYVVVSGDVQ